MITQAEMILPKYQHELKMAVNLPRWGKSHFTDMAIHFKRNLRELDTTAQ
jgi:hypothetical protein